MSYPHETAATAILDHLHQAETGLEGHTVILTDGRNGIVRDIQLDEHHGLKFTFDPDFGSGGRERMWLPVSRIREIIP